MAILGIKLDNILAFDDFSVSFSFPKQVKTSIIQDECLINIPSFRYKKLNVFVGANATGKTSLIKCIWDTLLFINRKEKQVLEEIVNKNEKDSKIEIDIAIDTEKEHALHRFKIICKNKLDDMKVLVSHNSVTLSIAPSSKDSYEKRISDLDNKEDHYLDYLETLKEDRIFTGWNVILPATELSFDVIRFEKQESKEAERDYLNILNSVFKTLDNSIINVSKSKDTNNAYVIEHNCGKKIILQDGNRLSSIPLLSSGTKYGVNISNIIYSIKHHENGIYLIDEQFSYVSSDVEAAMLSTMVAMLGPNEQIFFTTHNMNILSLGFPFHSFYFMKKESYGNRHKILINCGSEASNKNNVSPKTIIDNDLFATSPDVNMIFELGESK